ncbi:MAG: phage recombination protein Bet [Armatimonadetes bacterium]|nr:phage recombination protein Bet [Armatimonadota bacterium]
MSQELATVESGAIAPTKDRISFDDEKLAIIQNHICKNATPAELEFFLATCRRRGFDPIAKQIYFIKYGNSPAAFVVSIDALRLTADRTRRYAPGGAATYETDANGNLVAATAYVKKRVANEWHTTSETAYLTEFFVANNPKWKTMPRVMLSKAAEARALRRAFPEDLSGLYVHEEMDQAQTMETVEATVVSSQMGPPVGRKKLPRASVAEATPDEPENLTFKTGDYAGKTPEECDTPYLEKCLNAWNSGSKHRAAMKTEVERVLSAREQSTGDGTEEPTPPANDGEELPATEEARITDAQFKTIKSYGTRLHGAKEWLKVVSDSLGRPVGQLTEEQANRLIDRMKGELDGTAPAAPEAATDGDSPSLRALMSSINKAGLSMDEGDRPARITAMNKWLADTNPDPAKLALEIKSTKDLPNDMRFTLAAAIERGEVTWEAAAVDGVLVEEEEAV